VRRREGARLMRPNIGKNGALIPEVPAAVDTKEQAFRKGNQCGGCAYRRSGTLMSPR
jgi:hypothetical protein